PSEGPGFLGMAYAPFTVQNPGSPPQNISPPAGLASSEAATAERMTRRGTFLTQVEKTFAGEPPAGQGITAEYRGPAAKAHEEVYQKAFDLTYSKLKNVFDLTKDSNGQAMNPKVAEEYGKNAF